MSRALCCKSLGEPKADGRVSNESGAICTDGTHTTSEYSTTRKCDETVNYSTLLYFQVKFFFKSPGFLMDYVGWLDHPHPFYIVTYHEEGGKTVANH